MASGMFIPKGPPRPRVLKTENPILHSGANGGPPGRRHLPGGPRPHDLLRLREEGLVDFRAASSRHGRVTKLVAHDAVFRFLGIPIFYFPILVDSIAREPRQTGFLLPHVGNSTQKGYIIGDGFFWAINPSADLMLGVEDYSKRGLAERGEFRAKPSENADFTVNYFGVNDKYSGTTLVPPVTSQYITDRLPPPAKASAPSAKTTTSAMASAPSPTWTTSTPWPFD